MRHRDLVGSDLHGSKLATGTSNPTSVITPGIIGELYFNTSTQTLWVATGLTNTDWVAHVTGTVTRSAVAQINDMTGVYVNAIINGNMQIAQRGTSFSSISNGDYTLDRFVANRSSTGNYTVSQDSDVPSGYGFKNSLKVEVTTAVATGSIGVSDYYTLRHEIEGYNFAPYVGKTGTLSFHIKSDTKTGTMCVSCCNSGQDKSYISEIEITTNEWEFKEIPINFNYSGGTWNYTNGSGLDIKFVLMAGVNFQNTSGAWIDTNDWITSNQANFIDSTDNNIWITGVQLNIGDEALPFEHLSFEENLRRCLRYYEKSYSYSDAIGTITSEGAAFGDILSTASGRVVVNSVGFSVQKRGIPVVTVYSHGTGSAGKVQIYNGATEYTLSLISGESEKMVCTYIQTTVPFSNAVLVHWTADAEL